MLTINATFIFVLLSFVIFVFLMHLVCYGPIMRIIKIREDWHTKNQTKINSLTSKANEIEKKVSAEITSCEMQASKMIKDMMAKNALRKKEITNIRKSEMKTELISLNCELEKEFDDAKAEFKNEAQTCIRAIVSKVINIDENIININSNKLDELIK